MRNIKNKNIAGKTWAGLLSCLVGTGLLSLSSCIDYDDVTREVSVDIQLVMPEEFTQGSDMEGHTVTISQLNGGNVLTATTNAQGVASFHGIIPDVYNVSTSWDITSEEYTQLTGDPIVNEGAVVSGNINSQLLSDDNTTTPLRLSTQLSINTWPTSTSNSTTRATRKSTWLVCISDWWRQKKRLPIRSSNLKTVLIMKWCC